jgi:Tol biopolymer transport system component
MSSHGRHSRRTSLPLRSNVVTLVCLLALPAAPVRAQPLPEKTELVSVTRNSNEAAGSSSYNGVDVSVSADGRYVVFQSNASNIVPGDRNNGGDIFVRDRRTGQTERISVSSSGAEGDLDSNGGFSLSADGRYVAFASLATNLVAGDDNYASDVFVRDRATGRTERVSVASNGAQANLDSSRPSISADGRYVAFESAASNLTPGDGNGARDVFVRDRATARTERASRDVGGAAHVYECMHASISANGRFVGFVSSYYSAGTGANVWLRDRKLRTTDLVSVGLNAAPGNQFSDWPAVNATGRFVAFQSAATNLVAGDGNANVDIFLRDMQTGKTELVSVNSNERQANGPAWNPSISAHGRFVAFESPASNLVANDTNGRYDIFLRDRELGRTERVSVDSNGLQGNGNSFRASLNADGRFIVFDSVAASFVANDFNLDYDVFVRHHVASALVE